MSHISPARVPPFTFRPLGVFRGMDTTLSKDAAMRLATRIRDAWRLAGYDIKCYVVPIEEGIFGIKSNLVNGLPRSTLGRSGR